MPLILGTNSIKDTGYNVANSCMFDGSNDYMSKTPSSNGDAQKFTTSFWFKRGLLGTDIRWYEMGDLMLYSGTNIIGVANRSYGFDVYTVSHFLRDVSSWYHMVVAVDTTQGTAANRVKIYLNGTQITSSNGLHSSTSYPSLNQNLDCNQSSEVHRIGARSDTGASKFDGYIAEFVHIDGSQLAATSFGEFDEDSPTIWKPINVAGLSGSKGTNGFYLDFEDSSNLGNDVWGGTDLTETGIGATDQMTDTPTNNFCTLNPLNASLTNSTLSEGNLQFAGGRQDVNYAYVTGTIAVSKGKWYWEVKAVDNAEIDQVGVAKSDLAFFSNASNSSGLQATAYGGKGCQFSNGYKVGDGSGTAYMGGFSANDIMMIALDLDNGNIYFGRNGQWADGSGNADEVFGSATAGFTNLTVGDYYIPAHNMRNYGGSNSGESEYNFGSPPYSISSGNSDANGYGNFEYSVPSGYFSLCTKNLAEYG